MMSYEKKEHVKRQVYVDTLYIFDVILLKGRDVFEISHQWGEKNQQYLLFFYSFISMLSHLVYSGFDSQQFPKLLLVF